jgi:hypothetical protein
MVAASCCIENDLRDPRLLPAKVITKQSLSSDVACIHSRQRVVHEEMNVELRHASSLRERPIGLAEFVAPLRKISAILLVLDQVARRAIRWEQPDVRLVRVGNPTEAQRPDHAADHRSRQWNVERSVFATFGLGDVKEPVPQVDMLDPDGFQSGRAGPAQQGKQVKLAADGIAQFGEFDKPASQRTSAHACVAATLCVPVYRRYWVDLRKIQVALLRKSADVESFPFPGRTYSPRCVSGVPRAVKRFRMAALI